VTAEHSFAACDAKGYLEAGAALWFIVSPITGLFAGWLAVRYFRKRSVKLPNAS
jgi:hypothetical protein